MSVSFPRQDFFSKTDASKALDFGVLTDSVCVKSNQDGHTLDGGVTSVTSGDSNFHSGSTAVRKYAFL